MGLGNMLVLSQVTGFLLSFIFSFFIFIPVWINLNEFKEHCVLAGTGTWKAESPGEMTLDMQWGPTSSCNFTVFLGVVVMILSIFYTVWGSRYLCRGNDSSWLDAFVTCGVTLVMTIVLFCTALTVSIGFRDWCGTVTAKGSPIRSCESAEYNGLLVFSDGLQVNTDNFYSEFQMSQFGLWGTWICWLTLSLLAIIKLYRYHKQETFLTSMTRERERLLQRVGHNSAAEY